MYNHVVLFQKPMNKLHQIDDINIIMYLVIYPKIKLSIKK